MKIFRLFIVGGRDGFKTLNSVECFNLNTKSWQSMPPLSTHRHGVGVVLLEGPLYAIGGNDGWSFLNTVERWDSQVRSWNYVAPMNTPRSTHGVSVINKKIFAIGGRDVSACLRSVEAFDPNFNRWTFMGKFDSFWRLRKTKNFLLTLLMAQWVDMEALENKNHAFHAFITL